MYLREINLGDCIVAKTDDSKLIVKKTAKNIGLNLGKDAGHKIVGLFKKDSDSTANENKLSSKDIKELSVNLAEVKSVEFIEGSMTEFKEYSYLGKLVVNMNNDEVSVHQLFVGLINKMLNSKDIVNKLKDFVSDLNK